MTIILLEKHIGTGMCFFPVFSSDTDPWLEETILKQDGHTGGQECRDTDRIRR